MKRLVIVTNTISPYRIPLFCSLAGAFNTLVLHGGSEPNRSWAVEIPPSLAVERVLTLRIPMRKRTGVEGVRDTSYVHLNFGLPWHLMRFRPHIVVTNEMGFRTVVAMLYGRLMRVPVWVWWGGTLHSERNISRGRRILRRLLVDRVRHWISYGATTTEYLESLGVRRERILQIQNCVRQETFLVETDGRSELLDGLPRPVLLTVGQLIARKGLDRLIAACGRQAARGREFSLVIVGRGPERESLERLAAEAGVANLRIIGNLSQPVLNELYRAADVFVFPTLEDNWGLVVNEAMWAGLPVLCSQYAGCAPELVAARSIFDPMQDASIDAALDQVFEGSVAPLERERLRSWQEVGEMLCRSLLAGAPVPAPDGGRGRSAAGGIGLPSSLVPGSGEETA